MAAMIAIVQRAAGVEASFYLSILLAAAGVAGLVLLAGRWVGPVWGLVSALLLALSPVYTGQALLGAANIGATSILVWGTIFLVSWIERGGAWRAISAGLTLGMVPLIRLPEAIVGVPIAILVLLHGWRKSAARPGLILMLAAVAIQLAELATYHQLQFGSMWRSAYAVGGEQGGFDLGYLVPHAKHYARQMLSGGVGLLPALSVVGMVYSVREPQFRRSALLFAAIIASITLLYLLHDHLPNPIPPFGTRHLLPTFPFLLALAVVPLWRLTASRRPQVVGAVAAVVVVLQALWFGRPLYDGTATIIGARRMQSQVAEAISRHLAPGDVLWASEEVNLNLDPYRRWRLAHREVSLVQAKPQASTRKLGNRLQERQLPFVGMTVSERDSAFQTELYRWGRGAAVYWLVDGGSLSLPSSKWTCASRFERVDSLRLGVGWKATRRLPYPEANALHVQPSATPGSPETCLSQPATAVQRDFLLLLRLPLAVVGRQTQSLTRVRRGSVLRL